MLREMEHRVANSLQIIAFDPVAEGTLGHVGRDAPASQGRPSARSIRGRGATPSPHLRRRRRNRCRLLATEVVQQPCLVAGRRSSADYGHRHGRRRQNGLVACRQPGTDRDRTRPQRHQICLPQSEGWRSHPSELRDRGQRLETDRFGQWRRQDRQRHTDYRFWNSYRRGSGQTVGGQDGCHKGCRWDQRVDDRATFTSRVPRAA